MNLGARAIEVAVDSGKAPEWAMRAAIRAVCAVRLRELARGGRYAPGDAIAIATAEANAQHYEVPTAFYQRVLGPHLKYSSAWWPPGVTTLAGAEAAMLGLYAERAGLADGQRVLDLGSGWGSFSLWAAARYPGSSFTAVSNSRTQRAFVAAEAAARGLTNLDVRTANVTALDFAPASFDRVVSIEMLEHVRDHGAVRDRVARWLAPGGAAFVHVFAHHRHAYTFEDRGASDWMAREFFTGGVMPSPTLLPGATRALAAERTWWVGGEHYARTAEAWHDNLMAHRAELVEILGGGRDGARRVARWRVFFLACAELFGYRGGREWGVVHHRFVPA